MNKRYWNFLFCIYIMFLVNGCKSEAITLPIETSIPSRNSTLQTTSGAPRNTPTISQQLTLSPIEFEKKSGKEIGVSIVFALEKFYLVNGYYPENLTDLTPVFIDRIPTTTTNQEFHYVKYLEDVSDGPYLIYFYGENVQWGCAYHPDDDVWECGQNTTPD